METYTEVMVKAGELLGMEAEVRQNGWYIDFYKDGKLYEVIAFDIGLNKSLHSIKTKDKALCFDILNSNRIPVVEHVFFTNPRGGEYTINGTLRKINEYAKKYNYNVVLKPNRGGSGKNVYLVSTEKELDERLIDLFSRDIDIAISPYYDYDTEYRIVVLDGEALLGFGKRKTDTDFKHNLSAGSGVVDIPELNKDEIFKIAVDAANTLCMRFVTVDIINHKDGLKVLEVNGGVTLKRVAKSSDDWKNKCIDVYKKALEKRIDETF